VYNYHELKKVYLVVSSVVFFNPLAKLSKPSINVSYLLSRTNNFIINDHVPGKIIQAEQQLYISTVVPLIMIYWMCFMWYVFFIILWI